MTATAHRPRRRPNMRRAVILFPSGLTLGNLFFGVFAIVAASRLEFTAAGVYVLLGGIFDALDGRVARVTNAGTQFGEELDSLVDAITFGLAPAMIMYFAVLNRTGWDWIWVFLFCACAVMRLARFNIEQAGTAKTYFQGLPSPAAGITLASYYWFSQSTLYTYGAIADLKWHVLLRYLMVVLSLLMISNVPYPSFPRTGFRSLRSLAASILVLGSMVLLLTRKLEYFFPCALIYVAWGLARWVFSGLFERRQPTIPYDLSEGEDDDEDDEEDFELAGTQVHASRQGHRDDLPERTRTRREPPERMERAERPERSERPERGEKKARPERPARAAEPSGRPPREEGAADEQRPPRREKKSERPKRGERPPRPERADRPERPERPAASAVLPGGPAPASPPPPVTGVDAITLTPDSEPLELDDLIVGDGQDSLFDDSDETSIDASAAGDAPIPAEGAGLAPRKRKRRRRRGERKDRPAAEPAQEVEGSAPPAPSPYASEPAETRAPAVEPYQPPAPAVPPPAPLHLLPPPSEPSE